MLIQEEIVSVYHVHTFLHLCKSLFMLIIHPTWIHDTVVVPSIFLSLFVNKCCKYMVVHSCIRIYRKSFELHWLKKYSNWRSINMKLKKITQYIVFNIDWINFIRYPKETAIEIIDIIMENSTKIDLMKHWIKIFKALIRLILLTL